MAERIPNKGESPYYDVLVPWLRVSHNDDGTLKSAAVSGAIGVTVFGAKGDGLTDDTAAIQAAINANPGVVLFPPGLYLLTAPLVLARGVTLRGTGTLPGSAPANSGTETKSVLLHNFDGDCITVKGVSGDVNASTGYGIENLLIRQTAGNGAGAKGKAINLLWTNATYVPTWIRIRNLNIEVEPGKDDWTYGIYMDGGTGVGPALRDIWVENTRINAGANATAGIHIINAANVAINSCQVNGAKGILNITGSAGNSSTSIDVVSGAGDTIALDFATNVRVVGGSWGTITTTANTATSQIQPNRVTNTPARPASGNLVSAWMNTLGKYAIFAGTGNALELRAASLDFLNGAAATIGTLDAQSLVLATNNVAKVTISSAGDLSVASGAIRFAADGSFSTGPAIGRLSNLLALAGGTSGYVWFNNDLSAERMRLTDGGVLCVGTADTTNAVAGDARLRKTLWIGDNITAPTARAGFAGIYVDTADGDLKVVFGDGTVKTIVIDT